MASNNPHRFPRPPTLPESKIQIQSQREQNPDENSQFSFPSMSGRAGGQSMSFGTANERELGSPGGFATSFDLLSIAKMVPAKQRRASNPGAMSEEHPPESPVENLGMYGDWRKPQLPAAKENSPGSEPPKSMVFRRVAIPSSRLVRGSSGGIAAEKTRNIGNKQSTDAGFTGPSAWRSDGFSFFDNKSIPSPMETLRALAERDRKPSGSGQTDHSAKIYNSHNTSKPQHDGGNSPWAEDEGVNEGKRSLNDGPGQKNLLGPLGTNSNSLYQPIEAVPPELRSDDSVGISYVSTPMVPANNSNDSAGIHRAAAVPYEPKKASNQDPETLVQLEERGSGNTKNFTRSTSDPFTHLLPDNFYGSINAETEVRGSTSHTGTVKQSPKLSIPWKPEESQTLPRPDAKTMGITRDGFQPFGSSSEITYKKSSFGDAGISQLWNFPGVENDEQTARSEQLSLTSSNLKNFNPNAKSFSVRKTSSSPMIYSDMPHTTHITARDEPMLVPAPRKSPTSDLQVVERLETKAMQFSEFESESLTTFSNNASVNENTNPIFKENPIQFVDQRGRRGAISMQGTIVGKSENSGEKLGELAQEIRMDKMLTGLDAGGSQKTWLEHNGEVKIPIRIEGSIGSVAQYWPYPYPPRGVTAKDVTTEVFVKLNAQMASYVQIDPNGVRSDRSWGGFGTRKSRSGYPPGQEPWLGGDNKSFFDVSFGVTPSHDTGKVTMRPPPGLLLAPVTYSRRRVGKVETYEPGTYGLQDLIENSTPDYHRFNDDYKKSRARTLQEWNSTPISSTSNTFNDHFTPSRQVSNTSATRQSAYQNYGGQIGGYEGGMYSATDNEYPEGAPGSGLGALFGMEASSITTGRPGNRWGIGGPRGVGSLARAGGEQSEGRSRGLRPDERQEFFEARRLRSIRFGSDGNSDRV